MLAVTQINHVFLDLRQPFRESSLVDLLAKIPEVSSLRTLSWHWPLRLLHQTDRGGEDAAPTPVVSDELITMLLRELPLGRHLTHLASIPAWSPEQARLIRSLGVEPVCADSNLWMHLLPPASFRGRPNPPAPASS